jgi:hypothetical protein
MNKFEDLCLEWQEWAVHANKDEDGWESDFLNWNLLMESCSEAMLMSKRDKKTCLGIELCWKISEEDETLSDFAKKNFNQSFELLKCLASSKYKEVRWQVFNCLEGDSSEEKDKLLRVGITDHDSYVKRRALLILAQYNPKDSLELASNLAIDSDPYMRQTSIEFIKCNLLGKEQVSLLHMLSNDPVKHVREKALILLDECKP